MAPRASALDDSAPQNRKKKNLVAARSGHTVEGRSRRKKKAGAGTIQMSGAESSTPRFVVPLFKRCQEGRGTVRSGHCTFQMCI